MYAAVTTLQYWKSEHGQAGCEDAAAFDLGRGLFAVADGVSTAAFSREWARFLVRRFYDVPLLGADPFEVEWWLRLARDLYRAPDAAALPPGVLREKAEEGSASTLVTLRVSDVGDTFARAELVAIGDSCVFLCRPAREDRHADPLTAFPIADGSMFDDRPVCLHSRYPDPTDAACHGMPVTIHPGDVAILATDAVARWILDGRLQRRLAPFAAVQHIASCLPGTFEGFIKSCRTRREMVDDDCTALVLRFSAGLPEAGAPTGGVMRGMLGATTGLPDGVRQDRQRRLDQAIEQQDSVEAARLIGDIRRSGMSTSGWAANPDKVRQLAADVRRAMKEVVDALDAAPASPSAAGAVWQRHASLLDREPAAAKLRANLVRDGALPDSHIGHGEQ